MSQLDGSGESMEDKYASLRRCYSILVATELGTPPVWQGPSDGADLRGRTECLALSLGVLPQNQRQHLDVVAEGIASAFPRESIVDIESVKTAAATELSKLSLEFSDTKVRSTRIDGAHQAHRSHRNDGTLLNRSHQLEKARSKTHSQHDDGIQLQFAMDAWRDQLIQRFQDRCVGHAEQTCHDDADGSDSLIGPLFYQPAEESIPAVSADLTFKPYLEDLPTILENAVHPCVIIAGPGQGKTFAINQFLQSMLDKTSNSLELPILVDGPTYGAALSNDVSMTPLQFFFRSLGIHDIAPPQIAVNYRQLPIGNQRRVLMIDGWHEIPEPLRCAARRHIDREGNSHATLIASRGPITEWFNGCHPRYRCYAIAPWSRSEAVQHTRHVGNGNVATEPNETDRVKNDKRSAAIELIQSTPQYRSIAGNPYWMMQLCSVLSMECQTNSFLFQPTPASIPSVVQKLLSLERKRFNQNCTSDRQLTPAHFQALGRIAFQRHVALDAPNASIYDFNSRQSDDRSFGRFGHQSVRSYSRTYQFSHLECDVACQHLGIHSAPILKSRFVSRVNSDLDEYQFVDPLFQTYFAAQHFVDAIGANEQSKFFDQAMHCPRHLDIVCNAVGIDSRFRENCCGDLAKWIEQSDQFALVIERAARVAAAAKYPIHDLDGPVPEIRRRLWDAIQTPCRVSLVGPYVSTLANLDPEFLTNKLRSQQRTGSPFFSWLLPFVPPMIARNVHAGSVKNPDAARLSFTDHASQNRLSSRDVSILQRNLDANLRRIAGLRPDHPQILQHLSAIHGHPIRDGIDVIVQVAVCPQAKRTVRALAIDVLADAPMMLDRVSMQKVLDVNAELPGLTTLLRLAQRQNLAIDETFCERRLDLDSPLDNAKCQEMKCLVEGFLRSVYDGICCSPAEASQCISRWILTAIDRRCFRILDVLIQCITAENYRQIIPLLDRQLEETVTEALVRFTNHPNEFCLEYLSVIVKLIRHRTHEADGIHLLQALEQAISCLRLKQSCAKVAQFESLCRDFAFALVDREPAALMNRVWDDPIVQKVLAETAVQRDWLIYRQRIIGGDGSVIARNSDDPLAHLRFSTPEVVQEIASQLSPRQRNDFLAYWYVVSEGGDDYPSTDRELIHNAMCAILSSDTNTPLSERLSMCYRDDSPPKYSTWKKNLARVVDRCSNRPDWIAHLQKIGLSKKRKHRQAERW